MKKALLIYFALISLIANSQNYQPLNSHSLQLFFQQTPYTSTWGVPCNLWGTRIDSMALSINNDSIFYNYTILRDTALEANPNNFSNRCLRVYAPNWSGEKTIVSSNGDSWFFNQNADTIFLKYNAQLDSSFTMYKYNDGSFLKAKVENIYWTDDSWTQDSVKSISFQHIDSLGNSITDLINGRSIELYKDHGFRKTFDFVKFPFDTVNLFQLDVNYINANAVNNPVPQVGDVFTSVTDCQEPNNQYPSSHTTNSTMVMEVNPYPTGDSLQIKYLNNQSISETHIDTNPLPGHLVSTYSFSTNETTTIFHLSVGVDSFAPIGTVMPGEHARAMLYIQSGSGPSCFYPKIETFGCTGLIDETNLNNPDSCVLGFTPFECNTSGNSFFTPYIGGTSFDYWDTDYSGPGPYYTCSLNTTYIKKGNFVCGNYSFAGIEEENEKLAEQMVLYPNPASNYVTITLNGGAEKLVQKQNNVFKIFNTVGQIVFQGTVVGKKSTIDTSLFPAGLYYISLQTSERVLVKKIEVINQ